MGRSPQAERNRYGGWNGHQRRGMHLADGARLVEGHQELREKTVRQVKTTGTQVSRKGWVVATRPFPFIIAQFTEGIMEVIRMLYDKIVDRFGKVRISGTANVQYEIVNKEIDKLCELTSQSWGLIYDPWFQKVCKGYFIGGCVCTLAVCGAILYGQKAINTARKSKES